MKKKLIIILLLYVIPVTSCNRVFLAKKSRMFYFQDERLRFNRLYYRACNVEKEAGLKPDLVC